MDGRNVLYVLHMCRAEATLAPMIDRRSFTPLYVQLADEIAADIQAGTLEPDQPLPSETELMHKHGMSRGTVRARCASCESGSWSARSRHAGRS
jgi:hypothetical protein